MLYGQEYVHSILCTMDLTSRTESKSTEVLVIKNADGSDRWVWPVDLKEPLFLDFYHAGKLRSMVFVWLVQLIFKLRIQRVVFNKENRNIPVFLGGAWAMFAGTAGPNRKTIYIEKNDGKPVFYKMAAGSLSALSLANEYRHIRFLESMNIRNITLPKVWMHNGEVFAQSPCDLNYVITKSDLNSRHIEIVTQLFDTNATKLSWESAKLKNIHLLNPLSDLRLKGISSKLEELMRSIDDKKSFTFGYAHGDFTPWNMKTTSDGLYLYDWEMASSFYPKGFDAFHFIFQQGILVDRLGWPAILDRMDSLLTSALFSDRAEMMDYLRLYLIINTSRFIDLYNKQPSWHTQIYWLLDVWHAAMDTFLMDVQTKTLFSYSFVDFMGQFDYATLKADDNVNPAFIGDGSDLDIVCQKEDMTAIIHFCKEYQGVSKVKSTVKSNMTSLTMIMKNGQLMHLDLIHAFKRKSNIFMDAKSVIDKAFTSKFGLKCASPACSSRYTALFYALNDSSIPPKYSHLSQFADEGGDKRTEMVITRIYQSLSEKEDLKTILSLFPENKGINKILSTMSYYTDVIRSFFVSGGFIVTFSGVDGAGKTTILSDIREKLEKNLRREVVVLRHRPSLLPILSAWRYGKVKAELKSVSQLPRQGTNASIAASLFRFGYYYVDYLIGQWFIYIKYVCRGKIVIYDRYYFDFIADAKRSNIALPAEWVKRGYALIMSPAFNFFLFAAPEVILSRKQELAAVDISLLTGSYHQLFDGLQKESTTAVYQSIENNSRENTVHHILQTIQNGIK